MADLTLDEVLGTLIDEATGLVMNLYFYVRRMDRVKAGEIPLNVPEDGVEEVAFIESMEREIISGLCRLDDDDSNYSLRNYRKLLAKTKLAPGRMDAINKATDEYRKAINPAKVKLRNQYIGHRTTPTSDAYLQPNEFVPLAKMAVDLLDLMADERVPMILRSDTAPHIDLRDRMKF